MSATKYKRERLVPLGRVAPPLMTRFEKEGQRLTCEKSGFETNGTVKLWAAHQLQSPVHSNSIFQGWLGQSSIDEDRSVGDMWVLIPEC